MLEPAPKEMTINSFVETIISFWKTDEPWDADHLDEYATVEVEPYRDTTSNDITLKMWKKKEESTRYSATTNQPIMELFILSGVIRISHKYRYNPTRFSDTEAFVFKLYAAKTVLTGIEDFDPEDCDLTLKDMDC